MNENTKDSPEMIQVLRPVLKDLFSQSNLLVSESGQYRLSRPLWGVEASQSFDSVDAVVNHVIPRITQKYGQDRRVA